VRRSGRLPPLALAVGFSGTEGHCVAVAYRLDAALANGGDHQPNRTPKPEGDEQRRDQFSSRTDPLDDPTYRAPGVPHSAITAVPVTLKANQVPTDDRKPL
jgi:hypothetical protein